MGSDDEACYGPRARQCRGKRAYDKRSEAKRAARHTQRGHGSSYARMNIYLCPFCGRYHVGHMKRRERT